MNILVVAPQPFFTPRGTPFSVYHRTRIACELGHRVDLLTYGEGADVEIPGCRILRIPAFRWLGPVRVGPSLKKVFLDCFMAVWTFALMLRRRYDVVHAHEEAVAWCRWLKPLFRFRLVYDMHSSLPQQLLNFRFTRSRIIYSIFDKLERSAVGASDAVVTICPALSIHASTMADSGKIVLIENSLFDPVQLAGSEQGRDSTDDIADRAGAADEWVHSRNAEQIISYAGTLEFYQGIDLLLEAFSVVSRQMPDSGLLIIGGTEQEVAGFSDAAERLSLGNAVHFAGRLPPSETQRLVAITGVAISPRVAGNNTPLKIYQLMAEGIPVVATRIESHTQILNSDIAILSEPSSQGLADAMILALRDRQRSREIGERARQWYNEHYSRAVYTSKMIKLLSLVS